MMYHKNNEAANYG